MIKQKKISISKTLVGIWIIAQIIFLPISISTAAGPAEPTGPQVSTGVQEPIGPQVQTGPSGEIGPNAEATQTNLQTGPNSENVNTAETNNNQAAKISNEAEVNNDVQADLNSGQNNIGQNNQVGNVQTGPVDGSVNIVNVVNSTFAPESSVGVQTIDSQQTNNVTLNPSENRTPLTNSVTGPNSLNENSNKDNNVIQVVGENQADVDNSINVEADTGDNLINNNAVAGNLLTGDINLSVNLLNLLNLWAPNTIFNLDIWSLLGSYNGDIIIPQTNSLTGPGSQNLNEAAENKAADVSISQNSDIANNINLETNTGDNIVSDDTIAGSVRTGDTTIDSTTTNIANINTPILYLVNVFGDWSGSLLGVDPNTVIVNEINNLTGPNSANQNADEKNQDITAQIDNNSRADNQINIKANTGRNRLLNNTKVGDIQTGDINLFSNVINVLNSVSQTLNKFTLGIVNIFGNWQGNAVNPTIAERPENETPVLPPTQINPVVNSVAINAPAVEQVSKTPPTISFTPFPELSKTVALQRLSNKSNQATSIEDGKGSSSTIISSIDNSGDGGGTSGGLQVSGTQNFWTKLDSPIVYAVLAAAGIILLWILLEAFAGAHQKFLGKNL